MNNPPVKIEKITGEAFRLNDDWEKLKKLKDIYGVAESLASVILYLYDEANYPTLDKHALHSLGIHCKQTHTVKHSGGNM